MRALTQRAVIRNKSTSDHLITAARYKNKDFVADVDRLQTVGQTSGSRAA